MIKTTIGIDFCDFKGWDKSHNYLTELLSREYDVRISDRPEPLICSESGGLNKLYNCRKVFWTAESIRPDFSRCDYAMTSFSIDGPCHVRLLLYVFRGGYFPLGGGGWLGG